MTKLIFMIKIGDDLHSLISFDLPWKLKVLQLCCNITMDAAGHRLWSARLT